MSKKSLCKKTFYMLAALFLAGCATKPLPDYAFKQWGTHLSDYDRRNLAAMTTLKGPLDNAWSKDISAFKLIDVYEPQEFSSPAIVDNVLYTGSSGEEFYAIGLDTGSVLWSFDADASIEAAPTVQGDMVCFGSTAGVLRCLDKKNGNPLWHFQAKSEILSSPVISDGSVYFSASDDRIYALSASDGSKQWVYTRGTYQTVAPRLTNSPAYDAEKKRLYHFFSDGYLVCVSAINGKELWARKLREDFDGAIVRRATPLLFEGSVYALKRGGVVEELDSETGNTKNSFNLIKAQEFVVPDSRRIVMAGEGMVVSLDRGTGVVLWKRELKDKTISTLFASQAFLFVAINHTKSFWNTGWFEKKVGAIEAISLDDGRIVWSKELSSSVNAAAASAYDRVALITDRGALTVLAPE
ncbi:MAG: PQQ-binding-like beta-propeller repeat protein [Deltaproteobacteria bacterium]|nr:PQQ-binding-like beta-propeller repeat protein [Deltaproteobacteria bacterium]